MPTRWLCALGASLGVALAAPAQAQEPAPATPAPTAEPTTAPKPEPTQPGGFALHGFVSQRYRARWTHDTDDHDFWQVIALDAGDRRVDAWEGRLLGRWVWDLDGDRRGVGFALFDELADVRSNAVAVYLHECWAGPTHLPGLDVARVGRQFLADAPRNLQFDGLRVESEELSAWAVRIGGHVGSPVRLTDANLGRFTAGAFLRTRPQRWLELRGDWLHVDGVDPYDGARDDLWGATARVTLDTYGRIEVRHTRLEGDARDLRASFVGTCPAGLTQLRLAYTEFFETQDADTALGLDDLAAAGFALYPYRQFQAAMAQPIGEYVTLEAGVDARRLVHDHHEGAFNREFDRVRAAASVAEWPWRGLSADADWSWWNSDGRRFWTVGGSLGWRNARWRCRAGSEFTLYAFDTLTGNERERLRTWFAEVGYRLVEGVEWRVRYAWERDDLETVHRLEVRATWRF